MSTDLIIVGGGTAGLVAGRTARAIGARPTLVTDGPIGGDCTFTGCVPSKTLIAESRRQTPFTTAMARVQETIDRIAATESAEVLRSEGIDVIEGRARLAGPGRVEVEGRTLEAPRILLATGARPARPPIPGLSDVPHLTNETVFDLRRLPPSLGVIGGGPVGVELALAFAGFGTRVTIFELADRVLPNEEPEASAVIAAAMRYAGISIVAGRPVDEVRSEDGEVEVIAGADRHRLSTLLVATGRVANTNGLGLEEVGVETSAGGHVQVDDRLRTSVSGISAAGDVTGRLPFTHAAAEQARLAVGHAFGKGPRWAYDPALTPWVTFTAPEVARFGVLESDAPAGARVAELPLTHVDRAITEDRTDGFVKLIAAPRRVLGHRWGGRLVGATIVADRAGEMIHAPVLAARTGMFVGRLAQTTTAYPTWSIAVQMAAGQFFEAVDGFEARPVRRQ